MRKIFISLAIFLTMGLVFGLLSLSKSINAQSVPTIISHQGRLLNASNQPVTTNVSVVFAIYDAASAGNQVWTETQSITPDSLGFYDTFLGGSTALPSTLPNPSYLQITIQSETLSPRLQFGSVPFALFAANGVPQGASIITNSPTSPTGFAPAGIMNSAESWTSKTALPSDRRYHVAVSVNSKIYVIGGVVSNYLASVDEYDPTTNSWTSKASMATARQAPAGVAVNGKIYVFGGYNGTSGVLSSVEEYDPTSNSWTTKASMPTARQQMAAAVVNNKVYVIGGINGGVLSVVEEYDPATNNWVAKASMPTARFSLGAATVENKIYAIGGAPSSGYLTTVEEYNSATNSWTTKASMPTARTNFGAKTVNNKIYAIGGYNPAVLSVNEEYDPATNSWTTKSSMPQARFAFSMVALGERIFILGGTGTPGAETRNEEYIPPTTYYLHKKN